WRRPDPLFTEPCVRLGYKDGPGYGSKVMSVDELRASVWQGDGRTEVFLRVGVTVGKLNDNELSFRPSSMALTAFVQQILDGQRHWYPQPMITNQSGKGWAGWLLKDDVSSYKAAVVAAKEERRRRDEAGRKAAEAEARKEAELQEAQQACERVAREREEAAELTCRARGRGHQENVTLPERGPTPARQMAPAQTAPLEQRDVRASWWRRLVAFLLG